VKELGRRLKARREELGLSIEEVQAETKIRRRYLEALEAGDEGPIPGEVYVKGFLRFYANFLGLDGLEMVLEYRAWKEALAQEEAGSVRKGGSSESAGGLRGPAGPSGGRAGRAWLRATGAIRGPAGLRRYVLYIVIVAALVAAAGVWYAWSQSSEPATGPDGQLPPGSGDGGAPGGGGETAPPGGGDPGDPGPGGGNPPGSPGGAEPGPGWRLAEESASVVTYVVYGAPFTVGLEVTGDRCWVRVTVDGKVVLERTLDPGTTGEWTAQRELVILLGRPHLVRLTVDGQDVGRAGTVDSPRTARFEAGAPGGSGSNDGG